MRESAAAMPAMTPRTVRLLLLLVLAAGFALRCWYLSHDLSYQRFWDERYSFENVRSILETRSLVPAKSYYPSPLVSWPQAGLVAASDALHEATGWEFLDAYSSERFKAAGFLWVRLLSAVYGVAGLLMTFLLGRQLFSPAVGLLATTLLAFMPWHIHASAKFKPDALLVLTILLAFSLSVRAVREARLAPYLWTGAAIALALSSKLTGGLVAVPLVAATALQMSEDRRRFLWLCAAGVSSLAVFFALNPYGWAYPHFVRSLQTDYAMRAEWVGMTRASMPVELLRYLTGPFVHGRWLGAVALAAFAAFAWRTARGGARRERIEGVMLLVFPVVYSVAYLAATPYFKGNNLLPILPFTSLLVAWAVIGGWRRLRPRLPVRALRPAAALGLAAVLALGVTPGLAYVYRSLTPTTWDAAVWYLERGVRGRWGRSVYAEAHPRPGPAWEGGQVYAEGRGLILTVERLDAIDPAWLDRADGEVFLAARLEEEVADFYRRRVAAARGREVRVDPRWPEIRGPALVVIPRPYRLQDAVLLTAARSCGPGCAELAWPEGKAAPRKLVSAVVSLPPDVPLTALTLEVGDRRFELDRLRGDGGRANFGSRRFRWQDGPIRVKSAEGTPFDQLAQIELSILSWRRQRNPR